MPERARQSLRAQMQDALRAGQELDPAAVRRLAEFQTIGATPTRGMVTQDPVRITQEMNLAKMGPMLGMMACKVWRGCRTRTTPG